MHQIQVSYIILYYTYFNIVLCNIIVETVIYSINELFLYSYTYLFIKKNQLQFWLCKPFSDKNKNDRKEERKTEEGSRAPNGI